MGNIHFIKPGSFEFPPGKTLVKAEEYMAYIDAENILQEARDQAKKIIRDAEHAYEQEKIKGYENGQYEAQVNASRHLIETAARTMRYFHTLEEKVKNLVIQAIRKIINEIPEEELVVKVIQNILTAIRDQEQVKLWVCPKQVEIVRKHINEIIDNHQVIQFIDVLSDKRLKEKDCILESDMGMTDAGLDVQIDAIRTAIERSFDLFKDNGHKSKEGKMP